MPWMMILVPTICAIQLQRNFDTMRETEDKIGKEAHSLSESSFIKSWNQEIYTTRKNQP